MYKGKVLTLLILFIFINVLQATNCPSNGGELLFLDGSSQQYVCKNTASKTLIHLKNNVLTAESYVYVITNAEDQILGYSEDRSVDMSNAPVGNYRVWGVSYAGQPNRPTAVNIKEARFSDDCFKVSENFVQLIYADINKQTVLADGKEYFPIDEYSHPVVEFETTEPTTADFIFLVTNYRKRVIGMTKKSFDFTQFGVGEYEVFGYHYTGDLNIKPGDFMLGEISEGCFEKSSNHVLVDKMVPAGFPIVPDPVATLDENQPILAAADENHLAYETAEMTAEAAKIFDQEAAMLDALMIEKLASSLIPECEAYAGVVLPDQNQVIINNNTLTISASTVERPIKGKNGDIQYLLLAEKTGTIEAIASTPNFMISRSGTYHIYPMVANINHPKRKDYFDILSIDLGVTQLKDLNNQLSALCADLTSNAATVVVTSPGQTCDANAGTMTATQSLVEMMGGSTMISAEQIGTPEIPEGFQLKYILTKYNTIIQESYDPNFTVTTPGEYSIVALVLPKVGHGMATLNLRQAKQNASSIFQLIEYIDHKKICASVSNWSISTVTTPNSLSFEPMGQRAVLVVSR